MPLVCGSCWSESARAALRGKRAAELFPHAAAPDAALSGLWLYFSCFEECHAICQDIPTAEGSYWHAILHRQEPDAGNAAYWFRRVGRHPVFPALAETAREILSREPADFDCAGAWDPFAFIEVCERARQTAETAPEHRACLEIQRAEWQLLFHHCARPRQ